MYRITLVIHLGGYFVVLISGKEQVQIQATEVDCALRNGVFLGVNIRNELLKSYIIKKNKAINITILETELSGKLSVAIDP